MTKKEAKKQRDNAKQKIIEVMAEIESDDIIASMMCIVGAYMLEEEHKKELAYCFHETALQIAANACEIETPIKIASFAKALGKLE